MWTPGAVRAWLKNPPVSKSIIRLARKRWVEGADANYIASLLRLKGRDELYKLRIALDWPPRNIVAGAGRPRFRYDCSEHQLQRALQLYLDGQPLKVVGKALGGLERWMVYRVRDQEGWPKRPPPASALNRVGEITRFKQEIRQHLDDINSGRKPITSEDLVLPHNLERPVGRYHAARRLVGAAREEHRSTSAAKNREAGRLRELAELARNCPGCGYRAAPGEYSVAVGEDLYHKTCAPPMAA